MNAAEARKISRENSHKKASRELKKAIQTLNERIEMASKKGEFRASITIHRDPAWFNEENSLKLYQHFGDKGFDVSSSYLLSTETIYVSWSEENSPCCNRD